MRSKSNDYLSYLWAHPPRCARKATVKASQQELADVRGRYGDLTTAFAVGPRGGKPLQVWGAPGGAGGFDGLILVGSSDPTRAVFVFDRNRDGHDGECGLGQVAWPKPRQLRCGNCRGTLFRVVVAFQYGSEADLDPAWVPRRQDHFGWFSMDATCADCGHKMQVADEECA